MEIIVKGFITSKESGLYSECADNYAINDSNNKFAISDGVTQSFFPKFWSDILVHKYVNQTDLKDNEFIIECQKEWQFKIDEFMKKPDIMYYTRNAYNAQKSALATFVGLQFLESESQWTAQALGDSFLFFISKNSNEIEIKFSSKPEPIEFDNFPDYFSSNTTYRQKGVVNIIDNKAIEEGTFYLMTDALAEWFIKDTEQAKQILDNIQNQEQYLETIDLERKAKRLNNDDAAILIINLVDDGKKEFTYKSIDVNNLSELIKLEEDANLTSKSCSTKKSVDNNLFNVKDELKANQKEEEDTNKSMNSDLDNASKTKSIFDKF